MRRRSCSVPPIVPLIAATHLALALFPGCLKRPVHDPDIIVVSISSSPNNLDPRFGLDDVSQKIHQLVFDALLTIDDNLRVIPTSGLAERLDNPEPTTYVVTLRRGVRFHDGHELTSADVVHTFRSLLDPALASPRRGGFLGIQSVTASDRYTVVFTLDAPFPSFPSNLVAMQIVPEGADAGFGDRPIGTGPYKFERHLTDDRVELSAFGDYWQGSPRNSGLVMKVVPDEVMRALELRNGAVDLVVNDVSPDILLQLEKDRRLRSTTGPGVDYQYIGLNLRDPVLSHPLVRRALAHAIDRQAIVDHLRRGLATAADGMLPPLSWAHSPDLFSFDHDPARARALLDEAGYPDPDDEGPNTRFTLTLKISNLEFNRLQSAVIQQALARVGIRLDVRAYEFATFFADVIAGNFQLYTLQWTGGALADPDILRRVFHSTQEPPSGFNRGRYANPQVDRLLDAASTAIDRRERLELLAKVQRVIATDVPYISLWRKTNFAIARSGLEGIRLSPMADFFFLRDVARARTLGAN